MNGVVDCVEGASVRLSKDGRTVAETTSDNYGDFKLDKLKEKLPPEVCVGGVGPVATELTADRVEVDGPGVDVETLTHQQRALRRVVLAGLEAAHVDGGEYVVVHQSSFFARYRRARSR